MQTIILKHVQVFVVITFEIFQIFLFLDRGVGGVNCIQTFFVFLYFFIFTRSLSTTVKEKDLGVTMNANMKVSEQCRIAASKGNQVLGMIRRNITY